MSLAPTRAKAKHPHSPVKRQGPSSQAAKKPNHCVPKKEATQPTASSDSNARPKVTEVPVFMRAAWSTVLLPTLYDSLGRSTQPFADFSKGQKVVAKLQEAIDLVWPGTDFQIQWSDVPCSKVSTKSLCVQRIELPFSLHDNHRLLIGSTRSELGLGPRPSKLSIASSKGGNMLTILRKSHNTHCGQPAVMVLRSIPHLPPWLALLIRKTRATL